MKKLCTALTALGVLLTLSLDLVGCAAPVPVQRSSKQPNVMAPRAVAQVKASTLNARVTGAATWRIYQGTTQVSVMGFDADKAPIDTLRVRFNGSGSKRWLVSYEGVKSGGVLQLDAEGKVVANTFDDLRFVYGAQRAMRAWALKTQASKASSGISFRANTDGATKPFDACIDSTTTAVKSCGTVVLTCGAVGISLSKLGFWGMIGGVAYCLYENIDNVGQCAKDVKSGYDTCLEKKVSSAEDGLNPAAATEGGDATTTSAKAIPADGTEPDLDVTSKDLDSEKSTNALASDDVALASNDSASMNGGADEWDVNAGDPEQGGSWPSDGTDSAPFEGNEIETSAFSVAPQSVSPFARSRSCASAYALQCGTRGDTIYCRCKKVVR